MSRQVSHTLIGAFVLGAVALLATAAFFLGGSSVFQNRSKYVLFFEGSVKGLRDGAPVNFKGVTIGSVTDVAMLYDAEDSSIRIPVVIEIYPGRLTVIGAVKESDQILKLVERGLRAQLQIQSIVTSQLLVDLNFYPDSPLRVIGMDMGMPEIPTISSALQEISATLESLPVEEIAGKLVSTLGAIERLVNTPEIMSALGELNGGLKDFRGLMGSPGLKDTVAELNVALQETRGLIRTADRGVAELLDSSREFMAKADTFAENAGRMTENIDAKMAGIAADAGRAARDLEKLIENIDERTSSLTGDISSLTGSAEGTLREASDTLAGIRGVVDVNSRERQELIRAFGEMREAARALKSLAELLERRPDVLLRGKGSER